MNKILFACIGVLLVGVVGVGVFMMTKKEALSPTVSEPTPTTAATSSVGQSAEPTPAMPSPKPTQAPGTFTLAQVALHNSSASCYTTINGMVYDVTAWIGRHPGGAQAILSLCGKDGSAAFNDQHGGQRRPEQELASFKIGTLIQ